MCKMAAQMRKGHNDSAPLPRGPKVVPDEESTVLLENRINVEHPSVTVQNFFSTREFIQEGTTGR